MTDISTISSPRVVASPEAFRRAFRRFPSGVAIVTTAGSGGPLGVTVTSLRSLSATPPLLAFSLARTASTWPGFAAAQRFLVHLHGNGHSALASRFATSGIDRFAPPTLWAAEDGGLPRLAGAEVLLTCEKTHQQSFGDADLFVAVVVRTEHSCAATPLVYHDGDFRLLAQDPAHWAAPAPSQRTSA